MGDLRTLARVGENHLLEAIDEAVGAHLVQDLPGGKERYQFSHALIQQTLVGEWTASRRVRLHARIGAALEELYRRRSKPTPLSWPTTIRQRSRWSVPPSWSGTLCWPESGR